MSNLYKMSMIPNNNYIIKIVFVSILIDLLGFTIILPLYPSLLEFYKTNDQGNFYSSLENAVTVFRSSIGIPEAENVNSVLFGGMLGSLFSFLQFLNSPIFGAASDRYGRKIMILVSLVGSSLSYILWGFSQSFAFFLLARIIGGISEANVSISTAIIADFPNVADRSRGMAAIGAAFSVGFVFGPLLGAWFTTLSLSQPYFYLAPAVFSFAITVADIFVVMYFLPETLSQSKRARSVADSFQDLFLLLNPISLFKFSAVKSIHKSSKASSLQSLGVVYFLYLLLFSGLEFTLTFLVHQRFSFTRMDQGKMFAFLGIAMSIIQGGIIRRRMGGNELKLASIGIMVLIPSFVIVGFSSSFYSLSIGLALFSYAAASVVPCMSALASNCGDVSEKGKVMGILRSLGALARSIGPLLASTSYWLFGPVNTYLVGSVLLILPLYLLQKVGLKQSKD